jgi:hypothetical protein
MSLLYCLFCNCNSELTVLISVNDPLKRVLCRLSREHLSEGFSLSVHENISIEQETSVSVSLGITVCLCRYNGNASVKIRYINPAFRHYRTMLQDVVTETLSGNGRPL